MDVQTEPMEHKSQSYLRYTKQGPHGSHKVSSLKSLKIRNPPPTYSLLQPSNIASLSNSRWQNCQKRPNRSIISGNTAEKAKRPVSV